MVEWCASNGLILNEGMTEFLYFSNPHTIKNCSFYVGHGGKSINESAPTMILGVMIDNKLRFGHHCGLIVKRVTVPLYGMHNLRNHVYIGPLRLHMLNRV